MDEENSKSVFKSYLRLLLQDLKTIKETADTGDKETVTQIIDRLIRDTQAGIED